jgi:inner membrane transporter RhtA
VPLGPGLAEAGPGALVAPGALAVGAAVALLSSVIPYSLESESLRRLPANVFGVLMSLEPAVAALAGFVVLGQRLGLRELIAIALVICASAGVTRASSAPPVDA